MEYIKTDDSVYFTTNFYHPASGYSIAPDAIPAYLVYESGYSLILQGGMTAKPTIVGSYWGTFVASTANGFFSDRFYDVQVSGAVTVNGELISGFSQVKNFVVNDIFDANIVQVSGETIGLANQSINANVIQVSGEYVDIGQMQGDAAGLTAADVADAVWTEVIADHTGTAGGAAQALVTASGNLIGSTSVSAADIADAVWDETLSDHDTPGGAGHALVTASGNLISGDWSTHGDPDLSALATGTNLEAVSGVLVARTRLDADYFSWTSDPVSVSGIVDANMVQVSGQYISMSNTIDANIIQVSGEYVDVGSFSPTSAEIADSVWDETLGDHVADGGAGQALVTASGNLISGDWSTHGDPDLSSLATSANLEAVSGVLVARTRLNADYFDWTTDAVSVSGIVDANIVQVSGVYVMPGVSQNVNVTQVSGEYVDIGQMQGDAAGLTAADVADAVWTEVIADHTATAGGAAQALVTASGNLIGSTSVSAADIADAVWDETLGDHVADGGAGQALVTASGNLIGSTSVSTADIWSYATRGLTVPVSVSGVVDANMVQVSGEYIGLSSGAIDANVTQVSGEYVDIGQMQGSAGLTTANIADAVWTEVIADHTATAGGAAQALVTASGNLIGSTSVSAVDIRTEMDANSLALASISGDVSGIAGDAMRGTDNAALASDLEGVSGVMVARTRLDADYFDWTVDEVLPAPSSISVGTFNPNSITNSIIADNLLSPVKFTIGAITSAVLADNSITSNQIHTAAVTEIQAGLAMATDLEAVSGVLVSRTLPSGEYFNSAYNSDIYFAGIKYVSDLSNDSDEFAVHWFKNDQPVSSGDLTNPAISVYNTNTGAAVFENQPLSYAALNLGVVRYNNTPMILASGEPYLVETSGTIDAGTRTWRAVVGTDLL